MPAFLPNRWIFALLGAAILSLACAIVGMFVAREHLVQANDWVRHTSEVALSIGSCRLQVRDAQLDGRERSVALANARADAEHIRALTADNAPQQVRVRALVPLLSVFAGDRAEADRRADADRIDLELREMAIVEGALMDVRLAVLARARRTGWLVISVSSFLTVVLITILLGMLYRQSRALASAHLKIQQEGAMLESVVDSMVDGIMAITPERTFLHVNRAARRLLGDGFPEKSFPKDWRSSIECRYEDGTEMKPEDGALARAITGKSTDNLVYRTRQVGDPTDVGIWISATARPVRDAHGTVIAGVVALRDISEQKRQQDQLHAMSMLDELTGLHNRRGFLMLAEQHARVAQRHAIPFGIVFVDLNGLKAIDDSLGHEVGDQTIRGAGEVLRETFRESDILARLGGDEFVVLLANADPGMQESIAARLLDGVTAHNARLPPQRQLSLSVGIAFFDPEQPLPLAEIMVEADRLMYADKRGPRHEPRRRDVPGRRHCVARLRRDLRRDARHVQRAGWSERGRVPARVAARVTAGVTARADLHSASAPCARCKNPSNRSSAADAIGSTRGSRSRALRSRPGSRFTTYACRKKCLNSSNSTRSRWSSRGRTCGRTDGTSVMHCERRSRCQVSPAGAV